MEVATSLDSILVKKFSIMSNLNLPWGNLRLVMWEKRPTPSWLHPFSGSCDCAEGAVLQFWRLLGANRLGSSDTGSGAAPGSPQLLHQSQTGKCPPHRLWGATPLACVRRLSLPKGTASAPAAARGESSWVGQHSVSAAER